MSLPLFLQPLPDFLRVTRGHRVISWFSCGAASAIATVIAYHKYGPALEVVYCKVIEEHPDNLKFIDEFTRITGIPVTILVNEKYGGSIYKVFEHRKFLKGPHGAQCTGLLKKQVRKSYKPDEQYDCVQIFGYTVDEIHRAKRFRDTNIEVIPEFILIDHGINKQDCYNYLQALGLELPMMYKLGYSNNNCIGCVKGGDGLLEQDSGRLPRCVLAYGWTRTRLRSRSLQGQRRTSVPGRARSPARHLQERRTRRLRVYV